MPILAILLLFQQPDLQAIAARANGIVGFAAVHLPSGRTMALRDQESFPMQSVFKLPIAIEVLHQVGVGKLKLQRVVALKRADARNGPTPALKVPSKQTVESLLQKMVVDSDNVACDKLLALVGGPRAVDARMKALGIDGMSIRFSELEMGAGKGDNTTTPAAMVALLGKLARGEAGLSKVNSRRLDDLLSRVTTGSRRLKGELPPGTSVAHKTGTSNTKDGKTDATNDVGLVTLPDGSRLAIAVFVHASLADEAAREQTIAQLARAVYQTFASPGTGSDAMDKAYVK